MKICLLDNTKFQYSYKDKHSSLVRGAETTLINLYEQFKILGHEIAVFNNCSENINNDSSNWYNIKKNKSFDIVFDVAISNGDTRLFNNIKSTKKFVISYSLQPLEKFIRKGQLLDYIKHKPEILVLGEYHKSLRSKITSLFGLSILRLAVDDKFIDTKLTNIIDNNLAIFTSRSDRNLDLLLDIWNKKIQPKNKDLKLLVTPPIKNNLNLNIIERTLDTRSNLINDLLKSRVFLVPGHKAELFCLAAEEARELCLPIVTLGIGSLSERVNHEYTGFIAKNYDEFAFYTLELFNNNNLWNDMRKNLFQLRGSKNWQISAANLLKIIKS